MIKKSIIIGLNKKNSLVNIKELFDYKDLLFFMVKKEITVLYKQTVLGLLWAVIRPFFSMVVFSIIFGSLAKVPSDNVPYPIFSFVALVPWTYFSTALTRSTQSLVSGASLLSKVYFPRVIIPLTPVISCLVDFIIALAVVAFLCFYYAVVPTINILWLPLLIVLMILTASGLGMWFSSLAIQYRDIGFLMQFLSQLLMYAAPVVWPASLISDKYGESYLFLYGLYPMAGVIEGFRSAIIGHNDMPWELISSGVFSALLIFISGLFYFRKKELIFADVA
jgi:lipopolysaccharide transport system permease protein